jgi:hypothetical protein
MADYSKAIQWEAIGQGICILGIAASKSSVALFLLRIVIKKWHIAVLWAIIALTTILCIITTTLLFLQCKPAAFLWDRTIEGGVCWLDFEKVGLTMGCTFSNPLLESKQLLIFSQHGLPQWILYSPSFPGILSWA